MFNIRIEIWKKEEYHYPAAHGFIPVMFSYIHEDEKKHPAMIIAPGGAYRETSPSEAHLPAMESGRLQCIRPGIHGKPAG